MTDSRAALEENIGKFFKHRLDFEEIEGVADFYELESSSLKLLLSAMCRERVQFNPRRPKLHIMGADAEHWHSFTVELDSSGIPVLTEEILKALEAAK